MSTLIDQRILIPAPTYAIWAVLADANQFPSWRIDCHRVEIVTARQFGVGMRCRCVPPKGKARVEEITAWYEGLGYEYRLVDDRLHKSWVGRFRLQAVPDGTVVQWTINYQTKGVVRRLLDGISRHAQIEEDCADSLRQLHRLIQTLGYNSAGNPENRKRQTLQPVQSIVRTSTQPIVVPAEEAVADTKPRKPEGLREALEFQHSTDEMSFNAPYAPTQSAHPPTTPTDLTGVISAPTATNMSFIDDTLESALPPGMPESLKATPPQGTPKVDVSRIRYADEVGMESDTELPEDRFNATQQIRPGMPLPPPTDKQDTGEISIWDAFGIKPPSRSDAEALDDLVKLSTGEYEAVDPERGLEDTNIFSPLERATVIQVRPPQERHQRATPHNFKLRAPE